jgi:hypothetical protein
MSGILISASDYEPAVAYFFPYALKAIEMAQAAGHEPLPCLRRDQNVDCIYKNAVKASLILHNGHGSADDTTGDQTVVIWHTCSFPTSTVEKKIVFLLSCLNGQRLGPDMAQKGANAVLAFDEVYIFNVAGSGDPLTDPYLRKFFMPILEGYGLVLEGKPAKAWYDAIISEAQSAITDPSLPEHVKANISWDANHLRLFGDPNATIQPAPPPTPPVPPEKKKYRVVLKIEKDLTGYASIGRFRVPIYIYAEGTNVAGEAEEE